MTTINNTTTINNNNIDNNDTATAATVIIISDGAVDETFEGGWEDAVEEARLWAEGCAEQRAEETNSTAEWDTSVREYEMDEWGDYDLEIRCDGHVAVAHPTEPPCGALRYGEKWTEHDWSPSGRCGNTDCQWAKEGDPDDGWVSYSWPEEYWD